MKCRRQVTKNQSDPGFAPDWCVHFRSMARHGTCEKGIDYTALNGGSEYLRMQKLPCFIKAGEKPGQRVHCEHFRAPTADEIALHKQSVEDRLRLVMTVKAGIVPWRVKHQGSSHSEIVECPACRGLLHLSIKAHNGHVWGNCETSGCVSWTE
jgi:hypothetical protein